MSTNDTARQMHDAARRQAEREARMVEQVLQSAVGTGLDVFMTREQGPLERNGDEWSCSVTLRFKLIHPGDSVTAEGVIFRVSEFAGVRS